MTGFAVAALWVPLWWLVGAVGLALLLVLVAVLLAPLRLSLWLQTAPRLVYRLDARPFAPWVPRVRLLDSARRARARARPKPGAPPADAAQQRAKRRGFGRASRSPFGPARVARMLRALPRLLVDALGSVRWEVLHLDAEYGLGDPADTGQLFGCLAPLQYGAAWPPGVCIALRPNFSHACLCGELRATLRLRTVRLLPAAARFVWRVYGPRPWA